MKGYVLAAISIAIVAFAGSAMASDITYYFDLSNGSISFPETATGFITTDGTLGTISSSAAAPNYVPDIVAYEFTSTSSLTVSTDGPPIAATCSGYSCPVFEATATTLTFIGAPGAVDFFDKSGDYAELNPGELLLDEAYYFPYPAGGFVATAAPVPLPAAAWLMLSGLGAFGVLARRRRAA